MTKNMVTPIGMYGNIKKLNRCTMIKSKSNGFIWNKGEVLLAIYFFENVFGKLMRTLQRKFQKSKFIETKLRTVTKLDLVSSFVGHAALRQMFNSFRGELKY
jgi:hypothetical protein